MIITYTHRDGLYVNMTNRCSNRCDFCVRSYGDTLYGNLWLDHEPSVEEIIASIDGHDLADFSELVFCGYGEPTERLADMLTVCRYIRSISGIKIRLNTNGQSELINGKDSTALFDGLFDIVSISLNAADADTYDKMCHSQFGKAAYPAIRRKCEALCRRGCSLRRRYDDSARGYRSMSKNRRKNRRHASRARFYLNGADSPTEYPLCLKLVKNAFIRIRHWRNLNYQHESTRYRNRKRRID